MGNYITTSQVYAEGVSSTVPSGRIDRRIDKWEAIVEQLTKNVFRVLDPGELIFDGNNTRRLHFSLPLVEVTQIKINDQDTVLPADEYRAFTGIAEPQDHRKNPKIELTGKRNSSIYRTTRGIFIKGLDQKITAKWGYVDPDPDNPGQYLTPRPIQDVITQLVVRDLEGYFDQAQLGLTGSPVSPLRRERTDGHEVEYQKTEDVRTTWAMIPQDLAHTLALYRGPWKIGSPDPRIFFTTNLYQGVTVAFP